MEFSGLSISGFDFEASFPLGRVASFSFVERVGVILCDHFVEVDSFKLRLFPAFFEAAARLFSKLHAEEMAQLAAVDFVLPCDFCSSDFEVLAAPGGSIERLVALRQSEGRQNRFNVERCRRWLADDPELDKLLELASSGAVVAVDPAFVPVSLPDKARSSHSRLTNCFRKHLFKLWSKGRGVALPFDELNSFHLSGVHISPIHWTSKVDNADGRFLVDLSNRTSGSVVNSEFGLEAAKSKYGVLQLPTIIDILQKWQLFIFEQQVPLSQCRCFKDDVSSAFCQFDFNPSASKLLAVLLGNILFLFLVGLFGWTGAPIVFGLLSRALERLICRTIPRRCFVLYVDDIIALVLAADAVRAQHLVHSCIVNMFGPGSVELSKSMAPAVVQTIIGWSINLVDETIRPSDRGIKKLIVAFFSVDGVSPVSLHSCQVLASLAQRYSLGLRGMRCFVQPLHRMVAKFKNNSLIKTRLSSAAKFCMVVWKAVGLLLFLNSDSFNVNIWSLLPSVSLPSSVMISDAGPWGLGVTIVDPVSNRVVAFSSYVLPFNSSDPKYQNAREYMGYLFSILVFCAFTRSGVRGSRLAWRTDNRAAQAWVEGSMSSSPAAQTALLAVTILTLRLQFDLVDVSLIPGVSMGNVDSLSRGYATDLDPSLCIDLQHCCPDVHTLFSWCDPTINRNLEDHLLVFEKVSAVVDSFLLVHVLN